MADIPNSFDILQAVITATPDAIFVKDLEGRYVLVNDAAARFLGKKPADVIGRNDFELYPEEDARRFVEDDRQVLATGMPQAFEGTATGEAGTQAYLVTKGVYRDKDGRTLGLFGISHDITELRAANENLKKAQEALFRSQKLEAVGQLTGGIAHDFNNILAIILGNAELLRIHLPQDRRVDELIDALLRATLHGKELTSQLLAFSRKRTLNPQPVDVNALIADIMRLITRTLGATMSVTAETTAEGGTALVDPSALEAAVVNIALNARDAMPQGGSLTIRTSIVDVTEPPATEADLRAGSYLVLAMTDTGHGMAPEVMARAFEPFFTTKPGGRGTGLGLSMVYGFAKQSGGTVTIESAPGRGTTVKMFLPLASREGLPAPAERAAAPDTPVRPRTFLVVEDESDVRHIVRRQLESLGHRVLVAEAATEALLLLQGPGAPDALLTDVVLTTGVDGIELARRARELRPGLPVIFMSGYTAVPEARERLRETGAPLLAKPFTTAELEGAIVIACAT